MCALCCIAPRPRWSHIKSLMAKPGPKPKAAFPTAPAKPAAAGNLQPPQLCSPAADTNPSTHSFCVSHKAQRGRQGAAPSSAGPRQSPRALQWLLGSRSRAQGCGGAQPAWNAQPVPRQQDGSSTKAPNALSRRAGALAGEGTSALGKVYSFPVHLEMTLIKKPDPD